MEQLVADLQKMALRLQTNQKFTFTLSDGRDITDLIGQCKTQEDILRVANLIRDMLIPELNAEEDLDLNLNRPGWFGHINAEVLADPDIPWDWEQDEPNAEMTRAMITSHYFPAPPAENAEDDEEDSDSDDHSDIVADDIEAFLREENINTNWQTWAECFAALGYPFPGCFKNFFFDDPMEICDISEEMIGDNPLDCDPADVLGESPNYAYMKISYAVRFYSGILTELEVMDLATEIITWCEEAEKEYADAEGCLTDSSEEQADEIDSLFAMVTAELHSFSNNYPNAQGEELKQVVELYTEQSAEIEGDPEILMDLWTRIDALHEMQEDLRLGEDATGQPKGTYTDKRKRARIEFDIEDQPLEEIRFEQRQTDLLIDPQAMKLLIKEIAQDFREDLHYEPEAFEALHTAAEAYLIEMFGNANLAAINAELTHIAPKHMQVAKRLKEGEQL